MKKDHKLNKKMEQEKVKDKKNITKIKQETMHHQKNNY